MNKIEWRGIPGWPEYQVSQYGSVKRVGRSRGAKAGRIIKVWISCKTGYPSVSLYRNNVRKNESVHRLVAVAFIGLPPSSKHVVAHNDGSRTNNHWKNLRWDTQKGNMSDVLKHGTSNRGARNGMSKLDEIDVNAIRIMHQMKIPRKVIADGYGLCRQTVDDLINRKRWKHITDPGLDKYPILKSFSV